MSHRVTLKRMFWGYKAEKQTHSPQKKSDTVVMKALTERHFNSVKLRKYSVNIF